MSASLTPTVRWHVFKTADEVRQESVRRILAAAALATRERCAFHIVLSGGETPRAIYQMLCDAKTNWSAWHVYFGDERCAPPNDPERNSQMTREALLDHVSISPDNVHVIPAELGAQRGAEMYARTLERVQLFDLVLLGLGEDAHTASLFPGHDLGDDAGSPDVLAVLDAPKPPPQRVSLSAARLNRSRSTLFLVTGAGKRDAVRRWRVGEDIPVRAITSATGVDVLLDTAASGSGG